MTLKVTDISQSPYVDSHRGYLGRFYCQACASNLTMNYRWVFTPIQTTEDIPALAAGLVAQLTGHVAPGKRCAVCNQESGQDTLCARCARLGQSMDTKPRDPEPDPYEDVFNW